MVLNCNIFNPPCPPAADIPPLLRKGGKVPFLSQGRREGDLGDGLKFVYLKYFCNTNNLYASLF